jgi:hypothetical protein
MGLRPGPSLALEKVTEIITVHKARLLGLIPILIATAFTLNACAAKPAPEKSCSFVQNSEQQRVSWGSQVPVVMYIDSSVPNEYFDDIKSAANTWNQKIGREVIKIGGYVDTNSDPVQDGHNVIYYRHTWEPEKSNEQARTTVYWAGDRIYEADMRINGKDFTFSSGTSLEPSRVDMQSLVLHEFGHVLGLAHSSEPQSVMARSLPNDIMRRALSSSDEESIRCEY